MEDRNPKIIFFGAVTLLLIIALSWMLSSGKVGLLAAQLEVSARKTQQVDATWQSVKAEEGPLTAFLFYNEARTEAKYALFENRPGLSFGYFAVAGDTAATIGNDVFSLVYTVNRDVYLILSSTNASQIARVDVPDQEAVRQIELDPTQPFSLILPASTDIDEVSLYDVNGQPVAFQSMVYQPE